MWLHGLKVWRKASRRYMMYNYLVQIGFCICIARHGVTWHGMEWLILVQRVVLNLYLTLVLTFTAYTVEQSSR